MKRSRFASMAGLLVAMSLVLLACASPSAAPSPAPTAPAQPTSPSVLGATPAAPATAPSSTSTTSAPSISSLPKVSGTVTVMGVWGGPELAAFKAVAAQWEKQTGGTMTFESTRDLTAVLTARVQGGNPPDIAILPNPALLQQYATKLKPLNQVLDMNQFNKDYSPDWVNLGSYNGTLYGMFVKAVSKGTIWYSPKQFAANGYQIPKTWNEMISLSNQIVKSGKNPWAMGFESGSASGWPAADWIDQIVLAQSGPDVYDKWVKHQIPWTDPAIKSAFQTFGQIATANGYVPGGAAAEVSTNFQDATYLPFEDPPKAYMTYMQAVAETFINSQFPSLKPGTDYSFFDFPTINPQYAGAVTGGADMAVMFNDTPAARSFMQFMAIGNAWAPWAKAGGYSSPNKSFDPSNYPDKVAAQAAAQLTNAKFFRFGADDLMPAQMESAMWAGLLDYVRNPSQLDSILQNLENQAKQDYKS